MVNFLTELNHSAVKLLNKLFRYFQLLFCRHLRHLFVVATGEVSFHSQVCPTSALWLVGLLLVWAHTQTIYVIRFPSRLS